jgi:eukaryotic-like serine/threonine-protein kinase
MGEMTGALSVGDEIANSYRILGVAGAGGMGVVYRAQDLKLERTVALKFLPAELNSDDRRKRLFLREARTASSLDHPNIGVIHGIEESEDGRTFIIMAYYEGESLAQRIRSGPIPAREALDIALQMTRGLAAAHARQIAHRDIKPSNVMLTSSGSIKIVDFGLAHTLGPETATELGIAGTVAYMSPEQANGRVMDQRSDIWSVGVVLAEMLTGRNPFDRGTISATIIAILSEPPLAMDGVPVELQQIVYRALSLFRPYSLFPHFPASGQLHGHASGNHLRPLHAYGGWYGRLQRGHDRYLHNEWGYRDGLFNNSRFIDVASSLRVRTQTTGSVSRACGFLIFRGDVLLIRRMCFMSSGG